MIEYHLFIGTEIGDCNSSGPSYYPDNATLQAPVGTTTYTDGFASFDSLTWFPDGETTEQLAEQDLIAYYHSVKYLVGTNCANSSLGFCGAAQGTGYTQECDGCAGGSTYYTTSFTADSGSNPDSPEDPDQDITLIIIEN